MKYAQKMTCILLLVLSLSFGVGGCVLLYGDFAARLARTDELNAAAHAQTCAAMENVLRSRSRMGETMDEATLDESLAELGAAGDWQCLYAPQEGGDTVEIALDAASGALLAAGDGRQDALLTPEGTGQTAPLTLALSDGQQGTLRGGGIQTWSCYYSRLWGGYHLLSVFDLTPLYAERDDSLRRFLILEAAVLFCAAAVIAWLARRLTRPLAVLTATSAEIAAGDYGRRTALRTGDEVEEVSRSFDRMADAVQEKIADLEQSVQQREDFMGAFTHELKTPMTSIIGYADLLRTMQADPDDQREAAGAIYHESRRLEALSQKLLELLGLAEQPPALVPVPLASLWEPLRALCPDVPLRLPEEAPVVEGDADLLLDLLYNLVTNAVKAGEPGLPVRILCTEADGLVRLTVADEGRGIPAEELARVVEPFYMVDKSRARRQGGSGLGLALCQRIAAAHGSELLIESEQGSGTRVTVTLRKGSEENDETAS